MKYLTNKKWWMCAGVRALKTVAQTALATISTAMVLSDVDWVAVASASVLAGILSLLTSLAGIPEVEDVDIGKSIEMPEDEVEVDNTKIGEG
jgi:hypothetical protein